MVYEESDIKKHFIAYFDILGYEEKLCKDKNKGVGLLNIINDIIAFSEYMFFLNTKSESKNTFEKFLNDHAKYIKLNLQNKDKRIVQKYHWCRNYYNEFCKKYRYHELIIELE